MLNKSRMIFSKLRPKRNVGYVDNKAYIHKQVAYDVLPTHTQKKNKLGIGKRVGDAPRPK